MSIFQELRIRVVITLRQMGLIPLLERAKLEWDRRNRQKRFEPMPIAEGAHILVACTYYEHPEWVRGMIASIQAQSFKDWTLVLMDDGSPNASLELAVEHMEGFSNTTTLKAHKNQGAYACRNEATSYMSEPEIPWTHVTFIDPDDLAYSDWLEHVLECIGANQGVVRVLLERLEKGLKSMKRRVLSHAPTIWTRSVWEQLGGFAYVRVAADTELLLCAEYAKPTINIFKWVQLAQKFRIHAGNASQTSLVERKRWLIERELELRN